MSAVTKAESERITLLQAAGLLKDGPRPAFDALVRLAVRITQSPVALISLVDELSVVPLAQYGTLHHPCGREMSLCGWVVERNNALALPDLHASAVFATRLAGLPPGHWGAYLAHPIVVEGVAVGSVCVLESTSRAWSEADTAALRDVAAAAASLIDGEVKGQRARRMEARVRTASQAGSDWLWETDAQGCLQWVSASLVHHTGLDPSLEIGVKGADLYRPHPAHVDSWHRFVQARERREPFLDMIGVRDTPRGHLVVSVSGIPVFDSAGVFKGYRGASRNVTRQIEAEQQARYINTLWRQAVEGFDLGVMVSDAEGCIIISNAPWQRWAGAAFKPQEPSWPATLQRMIDQGDWPDARGHETEFVQWILGLRHTEAAHERRFRQGWTQLRDTLLANGSTVHVVVDITDRRMALDKLQVSETLYRTVAASIADGLLISEPTGRVVALNPAGCRILGVERSQLQHIQGPDEGLVILADDLETPLRGDDHPVLTSGRKGLAVSDRTLPLRRRDGQVVWVSLSCHPLRTEPGGELFAVLTRLRDVTHEREALMQLAQSEERWKFALEGAGDGVWDWDLPTGHVYLSGRWKSMLGYGDTELHNNLKSFVALVLPEDRDEVTQSFEHYAACGEGEHQIEFRMRHRDGRVLNVLSRGKVVQRAQDGRPTRVVGTHTDVTLLREAARTLTEKQLAEASSAAKSVFLSRMSHEIRTPLNAIHGFAQLLKLHPDVQRGGLPGVNEHIDQILVASQHLGGLINEVLDLQQVEAGRMHFHLENIDLSDAVARMLNLLTPIAQERSVALRGELTSALLVKADRQRLDQALMNLISNAIKYNRSGGDVRISLGRRTEQSVELRIQDSGQGMSDAQLTRLFQPFERLGRETSDIEGTGLGLIITRSLIEAMGGDLAISSQPGQGTCASVFLPRAVHDATQPPPSTPSSPGFAPVQALSSPDTQAPHTRQKGVLEVLYVEDNRINAMLFEEALRPFDELNLTVAEDGEAALMVARDNPPGVLVLDAHLPGMSGFEVLQALRALPGLNDVPAYMCSADAMPEDIERALACGFSGYWTKPIDILAVTSTLRGLATIGHHTSEASSDNPQP